MSSEVGLNFDPRNKYIIEASARNTVTRKPFKGRISRTIDILALKVVQYSCKVLHIAS